MAPDSQKGNKRKALEEDLKIGRKTNKQRIAKVGFNLRESGQYPTIMEAFYEVNKAIQ